MKRFFEHGRCIKKKRLTWNASNRNKKKEEKKISDVQVSLYLYHPHGSRSTEFDLSHLEFERKLTCMHVPITQCVVSNDEADSSEFRFTSSGIFRSFFSFFLSIPLPPCIFDANDKSLIIFLFIYRVTFRRPTVTNIKRCAFECLIDWRAIDFKLQTFE